MPRRLVVKTERAIEPTLLHHLLLTANNLLTSQLTGSLSKRSGPLSQRSRSHTSALSAVAPRMRPCVRVRVRVRAGLGGLGLELGVELGLS